MDDQPLDLTEDEIDTFIKGISYQRYTAAAYMGIGAFSGSLYQRFADDHFILATVLMLLGYIIFYLIISKTFEHESRRSFHDTGFDGGYRHGYRAAERELNQLSKEISKN